MNNSWRKLLAIGAGVGIEIREKDLEVTMARVRPSAIQVLGQAAIRGFRERPAAEWGTEYNRFLQRHGGGHLSATVLLPRRETIVRHLVLPGVSGKDLESAISLQIDTLHPYGDEEVAYAWSRLDRNAVLIGVMRRATLERYSERFAEAGIAVASFTFSATVIREAIRLLGPPVSRGLLAFAERENGAIEIYGESGTRPVFSAEFDMPVERAVALAAAELRLAPDQQPLALERVLPQPIGQGIGLPHPYAAALAGACPWLARAANLLPPERRASNSRAMWIPPAVLGAILLVLAGVLMAYSSLTDRKYLQKLEIEIARLEPEARKSVELDREIERARNRSRLLDQFRSRSKSDLDALNELTKLLPPPVWTNSVEMTREAVTLSGEADQAASLLKLIDSSPYFERSEFVIPIGRLANSEAFRIKTAREAGK
jgi:hypothetical protein